MGQVGDNTGLLHQPNMANVALKLSADDPQDDSQDDLPRDAPPGDCIAATIASQAHNVFRKRFSARKRCDTFFYTVVVGGNTDVVRMSVDFMERRGMADVLEWLLRRRDRDGKWKSCIRSSSTAIKRCVVFLALLLFNILTIPVFYAIHLLTNSLLTTQKVRISKNIRLPLVFALRSMRKDMWDYLISLGVCVTDTDDEGNNIFHYIADISTESHEQAIKMFGRLLHLMDDTDTARFLLLCQQNSAGLSALEYVSKFGNSSLLSEMISCPNLMRHTVLAVSVDNVTVNQDLNDEPAPIAETAIDYVDVSRYECGSLVHQSSVLNILSTRKLTAMSATEIRLFHKASVVGKWMSMKVHQMMSGVIFLIARDIMLTLLALWITFNAYMMVQYYKKLYKGGWSVFIAEEIAHTNNTSYIFKPEAHIKILGTLERKYQERIILSDERMAKLFDIDIPNADNLTSEPLILQTNTELTAKFQTALKQENYRDIWPNLYFSLNLDTILVSFARTLHFHKPDLLSLPENPDLGTMIELEKTITSEYGSYVVKDADTPFNLIDVMPFTEFMNYICIERVNFHDSDLRNPSSLPKDNGSYHQVNACQLRALLDFASNCSRDNTFDVYNKLHSFEQNKSYNLSWIFFCFFVLTLVHLSLDLMERTIFMYVSVADKTHTWQMVKAALGTQLPGSYLTKQINLITMLLFSFCFNNQIWVSMGVNVNVAYVLPNYEIVIVTTMLVLRFVMHIHSLRLLPGIGHFVITMFTMGNNLLSFSVVYGIVVFIFSVIFQLILNDPECLVDKLDGFENLFDSIFSTIRLTFGHGDITAFYSNIQARVTYLLYIVIVGLLLMNLIIAIMSSTATDVMRAPWSDTLWHVGWLEEALSAEYTFSVLCLPSRCLCKCRYISHQNAGYIVHTAPGGGCRMYLPTQHGPR